MPTIKIRLATLADTVAISAIHRSNTEIWKDPVTRQPTTYKALDLYGRWRNGGAWMSMESCAVHLNRLLLEGHLPLVAEVDGRIAGEAEYLINREAPPFTSLHLSVLYVHAAWQGQGVGQALIAEGERRAQALDLPALTTQPEKEVEGFYAHLGFTAWQVGKEMQLSTRGSILPPGLQLLHRWETPLQHLALRIGRYQCGVQGWDVLWPEMVLPGWSDLKRWAWAVDLEGVSAVIGLREQLTDSTQADGYAWLPPEATLAPAVAALQGAGAEKGFTAVDMLLPAEDLPALKSAFRLDYQTKITLWRKELR